MRRARITASALAGVVAAFAAAPANADAVADFYKGRTITVVSAGSAGAAHGTYAQIISKYMKGHLPGAPNMVMNFMPGAGGMKAMNYLGNAVAKDGTNIGVPLQDLVFAARLGFAGVKYDAAKMHFLGGADVTRNTVTVWKASGIRSLADAKTREVLMGASGKAAMPYIAPAVINSLLGTKFRMIMGYKGLAHMHMAMERGETHGRASSWESIKTTKQDWIAKDQIVHLVTVAMDREPDLPNVPALAELVKTDDERAIVELIGGSSVHGRAWIAPDVAKDRLAALRDAYWKTLHDPAFVAEAKQRGLGLAPVKWQDQQAVVERIMKTPDRVVAQIKDIMGVK